MIWKYIQQAGPLGYVLAAVSVLSLAVIIERVWFWLWWGKPVSGRTYTRWLDALRRGETLCLDEHSPEARALSYVAANRDAPNDSPLDVAMSREIEKTDQFLSILDTNAAIAPMIGILGTVLGIIKAFSGMKGDAPDTTAMVSGISVAMLTTAIGLVVALMSLPTYKFFADLAHRRQTKTAELLQEAWMILVKANNDNDNSKPEEVEGKEAERTEEPEDHAKEED